MPTCNGDCCAVVGLAFSYRELLESDTIRDKETLADMLVPITYEEARERSQTMTAMGEDYHPNTRRYFYKCNRWDEETRLCTRYEERPQMCSAYPYGDSCCISGCEYEVPQDVIDNWRNSCVAPVSAPSTLDLQQQDQEQNAE